MVENTYNSRLIMLEDRVLMLEKGIKKLATNMHALHSNDELFLHMVKTLTGTIECNQKIDDMVHETVLNRIKGLNMNLGKLRKKVNGNNGKKTI